jgi:diacylglycerol kinase
VLVSELFNTAVERLGTDAASGEQRSAIRNIKDISAAAVLVSALTALAIGVIILLIPLSRKIITLI